MGKPKQSETRVEPAEVVGVQSEAMPIWLKRNDTQTLTRLLGLHGSVRDCASRFAVAVVMCGLAMIALKRRVGHGKWMPYVEEVLTPNGISHRMVTRYIAVAEAAWRTLPMLRQFKLERLLDGPVSMDDPDLRPVSEMITEATVAETWRELMLDLGLTKEQRRGGFHPPRQYREQFAALRGLASAEYAEWPEAVQAEFREWLKDELLKSRSPEQLNARKLKRAANFWQPFLLDDCPEARRPRNWVVLPPPSRAKLRDSLRKLADEIDASLANV